MATFDLLLVKKWLCFRPTKREKSEFLKTSVRGTCDIFDIFYFGKLQFISSPPHCFTIFLLNILMYRDLLRVHKCVVHLLLSSCFQHLFIVRPLVFCSKRKLFSFPTSLPCVKHTYIWDVSFKNRPSDLCRCHTKKASSLVIWK